MNTSRLSKIHTYPGNPIELFKNLIHYAEQVPAKTATLKSKTITMSLATLDSEFGVLNRSVIYRGLIDNSSICFVTERSSRKYQNLLSNPKIALTILLTLPGLSENSSNDEYWQIRLLNACAEEIKDTEILTKLWEEEPLHAKIRSYICECGKPIALQELQIKHDRLLAKYKAGQTDLKRTHTYTAFKITANIWDFYKAESFSISDRLQYKRNERNPFMWDIYHVAA